MNSTLPFAQGKPQFQTYDIRISSGSELPNDNLTISVTFTPNPASGLHYVPPPELIVGSFVVVRRDKTCTHAGVVVNVDASPRREPVAEVALWTLSAPVQVSNYPISGQSLPGRLKTQPYEHPILGHDGGESFHGSVTCLKQAAADHLRAQIGPYVPDEICRVFWAQCEIAQLRADSAAQARYTELAQELIDSLQA